MTPYEIIAIIFSSFALVVSIPAMILSIKNLQKMAFTIDFRPDNSDVLIITENKDKYWCDANLLLINKSDQHSTINKITVVDGAHEQEIYLSNPHGQAPFRNTSFEPNSSNAKRFSFKLSSIPDKTLKFKIYTNRKTFTKKIACKLST